MLHFRSPQYRSPSSRFLSWSAYKEIDAPFPKPSLTCFSGTPSKGVPSPGFPYGGPMCRDRGFISRAYFYVSFRVPSKEALPPVSPKSSHRERGSVSRAFFYLSLKVPRKKEPPTLQVLPIGPSMKTCSIPRTSLTTLQLRDVLKFHYITDI
jgi:hypothetical protein